MSIENQESVIPELALSHYQDARAVMEMLTGRNDIPLKEITTGRVNIVFLADYDPLGSYNQTILRMNYSGANFGMFGKFQAYEEELRGNVVPVPRVYTVGETVTNGSRILYSLSDGLSGRPMTAYTGDMRKAWEQVGRIDRKVNSVKTNGTGYYYDSGHNTWKHDGSVDMGWKEYLERSRQRFVGSQEVIEFIKHSPFKSFRRDLWRITEDIFRYLESWSQRPEVGPILPYQEPSPVLQHGDLTKGNILVDDDGNVTGIIDWDQMCSMYRPPAKEIAKVILDSKTSVELEDFCIGYRKGYGVDLMTFTYMFNDAYLLLILDRVEALTYHLHKQNFKKARRDLEDLTMRCHAAEAILKCSFYCGMPEEDFLQAYSIQELLSMNVT